MRGRGSAHLVTGATLVSLNAGQLTEHPQCIGTSGSVYLRLISLAKVMQTQVLLALMSQVAGPQNAAKAEKVFI